MKKFILLILFLKILLFADCKIKNNKLTLSDLPDDTKQLIVVTAKNFNSTTGILQRYEKVDKWQKVGKEVSVFIGQNGLAWGRGVCKLYHTQNIKEEGDKKSPAGIFELGTAFGYTEEEFNYEYIQSDGNLKCVDDSNSNYYNEIVYQNYINVDYNSSEEMKRDDDLYSLGIVVKHNPEAIKDGGSCIFLHVRNATPTVGCTSMDKDKLRKILEWLDSEKYPLLIQLPKDIFDKLKID